MYWKTEQEELCERYRKGVNDNNQREINYCYLELKPKIEYLVRSTYFTKDSHHLETCINHCYMSILKKYDGIDYFGYLTVTSKNFHTGAYTYQFKPLTLVEDISTFNAIPDDIVEIDTEGVLRRLEARWIEYDALPLSVRRYANVKEKRDRFRAMVRKFLIKFPECSFEDLFEYLVHNFLKSEHSIRNYFMRCYGITKIVRTNSKFNDMYSPEYEMDDHTPDLSHQQIDAVRTKRKEINKCYTT